MAAYIGGMDPADIGADAFQFLVNNTPGEFEKVAEWTDNGMSARDIAKSVAHGNTNLESFLLLSPDDLAKPNYKTMISAGALRVYLPKLNPSCKEEWTFRGKVVAFSGVNLAERLFGNKSYESRKKALQIQEDVFNANFPVVRQFHRKIMAEIEDQSYIKNALGATLDIYGPDDEDCKIAASVQSQGNSAYFVQGVMLRLYRDRGIIPNLQVHDELVVEVPKSMSDKDALEYMALMGAESQRLPGFRCAAKVKRGPNWGEMKVLGYV
jgi:hypothetical protein